MNDNELHLLRMYQVYSKYSEYWKNEELIEWKLSLLPESLEGKTVLDVGSFEGFFSLVCEQRGAKQVVAVDNDPNQNNFCYRKIIELIQSKAEPHWLNLLYLENLKCQFDIVLFLDVLSYQENPLTCLKVIRKSCQGELYFCDRVLTNQSLEPIMKLNDSISDTFVWTANEQCLQSMFNRAELFPVDVFQCKFDNRVAIKATVMNRPSNPHGIDYRILHG